MERKTIDFGIDLGTTNSAVACMNNGELKIIKNQTTNSDLTPSAVTINAKGTVTVGQLAYDLIGFEPEDAVGGFKRWMGNPSVDAFTFKRAGRRMTAAELSAEVLKSLKQDVSSRLRENIRAAVITVPARFLIPACQDTTNAGRIAGIEIHPLLMEPVAAAIGYGLKTENIRGRIMVFDLGGGTFDVSVLTVKNDHWQILGFDGDDKLGGTDYDWCIVQILTDRINQEYGDTQLRRGYEPAGRAIATLKYRAEEAKKQLTAHESFAINVNRLGGAYDVIDTEIEVTRTDFEQATSHLTHRCVNICDRLLTRLKLSVDDLEAVIVVGGQTRSPYIREQLAARFQRTDYRLDPMTIVAEGAAIFASTQRLGAPSSTKITNGVQLNVAYNPISAGLDADVGVVVTPVLHRSTLSVTRSDRGWSSGSLQIPKSGQVLTTVALRARKANNFEIRVFDGDGSPVETGDTNFTITQGLQPPAPRTALEVSVALANNEAEILLEKNAPLPAKKTLPVVTVHEVVAGDPTSQLNIYILEGGNPRADRNWRIGYIGLRGDEIRRSLPVGETVQIRLNLNESKTFSCEAFFPFLNESRPMKYEYERPSFRANQVERETIRETERITGLEKAAPQAPLQEIRDRLNSIHHDKDAAGTDPDFSQKAAQDLFEIKADIDRLEKEYERQLLAAELSEFGEPTVNLADSKGLAEQKTESRRLLAAANDAMRNDDTAALRDATSALQRMYWNIAFAQDDFWKVHFARLVEMSDFADPLGAERLKEEGARALKRNDVPTLRTIVWELYGLLPSWQRSDFDERFPDAGITRVLGANR